MGAVPAQLHDLIAHLRLLPQALPHSIAGLLPQARDKPAAPLRQGIKEAKGEVAQIEDQQAVSGQPGQELGLEGLVVGSRIFGKPDLGRQVAEHIHHHRQVPTQGRFRHLLQGLELAEQALQRGAVQG